MHSKGIEWHGKAQEVKRKRRETDASRAEEETHGGHLPGSGDERMENENRERGKLWHYQF